MLRQICLHLLWKGSVMFPKYFNEGATYNILETSTLRQYADIRNLSPRGISATRIADIEVCSQDTVSPLRPLHHVDAGSVSMFRRYNLPPSSSEWE
jgi:hypothetical protein